MQDIIVKEDIIFVLFDIQTIFTKKRGTSIPPLKQFYLIPNAIRA